MSGDPTFSQGWIGILLLLTTAWGFSEDRRNVRWRLVVGAMLLQLVIVLVMLRVPLLQDVFLSLNRVTLALSDATKAGTSLVFGYIGGGPTPFGMEQPANSFILAFQALPLVLVVSALSALLYYWRVLPLVVKFCSAILQRTLGVGGAVGIGAAANIFVGMVEAPLLIRPYLHAMSRGELFMVMTCGMSTIAGTVLVLYAQILEPVLPAALGHVLTASLISAPAALMISHLLIPDTGDRTGAGELACSDAHGSMDAVVKGVIDGVGLLLNIVAMLIVFVALVSLVNHLLALIPAGESPLTLQSLLGWLLAPLAWTLGIPWSEAVTAGGLIGTKTVLNEFVAYLNLSALPPEALSPRSRLILIYAMCGFANFGSLGIMIGGMGAMVPERRRDLVGLGMKSVLSGTMATCITGAIIGLLN
ncbi:MAG: nucleoside:proton symporter [Desulfuromonas sp.]|nr:MAG: nucleoside:proton symporter [Desulfuromonas sp.]